MQFRGGASPRTEIMSNDSSRRRRLGRAKSNSERVSPPDSILRNATSVAAPPSFSGNPTIPLPPMSTTPPKKTWEQHYKSFLTRRVLGNSPKSADYEDSSGSGRNGKFPGSRRLFRSRSKSSELIPPMPSLTQTKSYEDLAIRGGNFFQSVFSRNKSDASSSEDHSGRGTPISQSKSDGPISPSQKQRIKSRDRIKSMDSLDTTLKGGQDKAVQSPKVIRSIKHYDDLETPVHAGVPTRNTSRGHLPAALSNTSTQSREMKKAFTEFHNSAKFSLDASSPYLGDEPSIRPSNYLAMPKRSSVGVKSEHNLAELLCAQSSRGSSLPTVQEDAVVGKSTRVLKPLQGPESWDAGRRYLIAPAALSVCPLHVLSSFSSQQQHLSDYTDTAFGTVELGVATVKYVGTKLATRWSSCKFILKQNYLLEYNVDASWTAAPRGFAHLQYSRCYPHHDFADALELEFYASPCARADKRVLFMRLSNRDDRDRWVMCLNDAAKLTIRDLYDYDEGTKFGHGRYAVVYPARRQLPLSEQTNDDDNNTKPPQYTCALKVIDKNEFWRRVVKGLERSDTIVRETSVQATLTAKCSQLSSFLRIRGIFETSDNYVIELELLEGTDLFHYISSNEHISETAAAQIMFDILTSLDVMSRIGLAHRDIKPANILMCNKDCAGVSVKVADFGMAGFAGVDGHLRGRCGTPGYVAPEIFTAAVHGGYGNKVDVFSAGVTLYVLLCGYEPFYGESDMELIEANKAAVVEYPKSDWSKISLEARDLVMKMLQRDPKDRISAKDALQHPWIVNRVSPRETEDSGIASVLSKSVSNDASTVDFIDSTMTGEGSACTIC